MTTLKQAPVKVQCDLTKYIQRTLYFLGEYEASECVLWMERARSAHTILDVGANVGLYTLLAAWVNPSATIHAFEPTPELFHAFQRNVELNGFRNVVARSLAVTDQPGPAYLNLCSGMGGDNEGMNFVSREPTSSPCEGVTIESYCEEAGIAEIDLLKLDIEGGEFRALEGAGAYLREGRIRCIFLELCEYTNAREGHTTDEIRRLLSDCHYSLFRVTDGNLEPLRLDRDGGSDNVVALIG